MEQLVTVALSKEIKKHKRYKVYSPKKFLLLPGERIFLDLNFTLKVSEKMQPWLNLTTSLKESSFLIENEAENKLKLLNKSDTHTVFVEKNQCIGHIYLLGESKKR